MRNNLESNRLVEVSHDIFRQALIRVGYSTIGKPLSLWPLTKKERFAGLVVRATGNILMIVDQLHFSIDLLSGYRNFHAPRGMSRYDHLVYAIENFYLRLTSVYDRCLRMTNELFLIGLPMKECRTTTIVENRNIRGTSVGKALRSMSKFSKGFASHRNTIAHEETYFEDAIYPFYLLGSDDPEIQKYKHFLKRKADLFVKTRKGEFKENLVRLETLVTKFFDCCFEHFSSELGE